MAFPTHRTRAGYRVVAALSLTAGLLTLPVGCELLREERQPEPVARSTEPTSQPPTPAVVPQPGKFATRSGCCIFYTDFELDKNDPLFAELETLPDQITSELHLPPSNTIVQVYLFDSQERYERFMFAPRVGRYWKQPARRAYFFAEPRIGGTDELKVYTWLGDPATLRTDLRHELTHALLHGVLKEVPLWLDEGLASYFELPPTHEGVNPHHLEVLRGAAFHPDLARLEKLDQVKQMEKPEYRESWAWVHFMLRGHPGARRVLHDYLQSLRTSSTPGELLPKLREVFPDPDRALVEHIGRVEFPPLRRK